MYNNELSFRDHEAGLAVAKLLLNEHYVVLLSYEEDLLILNYEYSSSSNRNDVIFMSKDEAECEGL